MVNNMIKKIVCLLILILFMSSCVRLEDEYNADRLRANVWSNNTNEMAKGYADKLFVPNLSMDLLVDNISAESYYVSSVDRNRTNYLKYKNPYKQMNIASLTKMMTALVVLENCEDLNKQVVVSDEAVKIPKDASIANLMVGDRLTMLDLLYALLLPSGNDAAIVLAENLNGSYENFLLLMNNTANRLGALHTHFSNANGLDSEYHYSSSYDLYLILTELLKYPLFKEITSKKQYTANIIQIDGTTREQTWETTNLFITGELGINEKVELEAGKTGFTATAGNCLAIISKSKLTGEEYISIVLNANSKKNMYINTNSLLSEAQ